MKTPSFLQPRPRRAGDESNLMLWISLMILSAGTVLAVIFGKKKSKASK